MLLAQDAVERVQFARRDVRTRRFDAAGSLDSNSLNFLP